MKIFKFIPIGVGEKYSVLAKDKKEAYSFIYRYLCAKHKFESTPKNFDKILNWLFENLYEIQEIKIGQVIEE